ncbi:MAG: hypothetical protein JWM53_3210 [bacterium]|nr:hypothetical protein [bacterium]
MPAKTPSKGKKAAAPKAPKKAAPAGKAAKKPPVVEDEAPAGDEPDDDEDDDFELDDEAPRAAAKPAAPVVKKPAAPAAAARGKNALGEDAPAVVPARRLTPEAKARVNEMVRKGMSLGDALKAAAAWETFVAPVKDEPAKLVQGRMSGGGGGGGAAGGGGGPSAEPRSNFGGETEPDDIPEAEDEPVVADED